MSLTSILWVLLVWQDRADCYATGLRWKSSDCLSLVRDRKYILLLLLYYYHLEYIWMIIGDRTEWYFWSGLGWAFERGSDCTCFARVDWGPSVAVDFSQVTDLLSWAHTYLWERECSLLSCCGFRLFLDRLIGGRDGGGLSNKLSPRLGNGGLESKFGRGPRPLDRSGMGWSCLCLGYKWSVYFGVPI